MKLQSPASLSELEVFLLQGQSWDGNHGDSYHLEIRFNHDASLPNSKVIDNAVNLPNKFGHFCLEKSEKTRNAVAVI